MTVDKKSKKSKKRNDAPHTDASPQSVAVCKDGKLPLARFDFSMRSQIQSVYSTINDMGGLKSGDDTGDFITALAVKSGVDTDTVAGYLKNLDARAQRLANRNALRFANKVANRYNRDNKKRIKSYVKRDAEIARARAELDAELDAMKTELAKLADVEKWMSVTLLPDDNKLHIVSGASRNKKRPRGDAPVTRKSRDWNARKTYTVSSSFEIKDKDGKVIETVPYDATVKRMEKADNRGSGKWKSTVQTSEHTVETLGSTLSRAFRTGLAQVQSAHKGQTVLLKSININVPEHFSVPVVEV